jgi:hypothetical protein
VSPGQQLPSSALCQVWPAGGVDFAKLAAAQKSYEQCAQLLSSPSLDVKGIVSRDGGLGKALEW